jgi:starch-binding outer membrane protein, SusD/RagB family
VYLQMGNPNLYGRELNIGLLSVLGRSYDTPLTPAIGNFYYQGAAYNFQDPTVNVKIDTIWNNMYTSIANVNNIIAQIDAKKNIFAGNDYNIIKGEVYGLRAFLHFDLLRLFGPSAASANLSALAIPYVKQVGPSATPVSTVEGVLDNCIADLMVANNLIPATQVDPTHLNNWGAKGLLARIYLYKGDFANANIYAQQIITSKQFPLSVTNSDLLFQKEIIFSLFVQNYTPYINSVFAGTYPLGLTAANQTALYVTGGGSTADWRKSFVDPSNGSTIGNTISPKKWYYNITYTKSKMPLLRLSEMYYIAAECANANRDSTTARALLDTMRVHRNLPAYVNATLKVDSINNDIKKEYQKEFIGEGQTFYFYKRKNLSFSQLPFTVVPVVSGASYVLPKGN